MVRNINHTIDRCKLKKTAVLVEDESLRVPTIQLGIPSCW